MQRAAEVESGVYVLTWVDIPLGTLDSPDE